MMSSMVPRDIILCVRVFSQQSEWSANNYVAVAALLIVGVPYFIISRAAVGDDAVAGWKLSDDAFPRFHRMIITPVM